MDWSSLRELRFEPVDEERFGAIGLAHRVIERGGTAGAILNGANEAAVAAFLDGQIRFPDVARLVGEALDGIPIEPANSLPAVLAADGQAREFVESRLEGGAGSPSPRVRMSDVPAAG